MTAHVELIDGSGTVRETNDFQIHPPETREVAGAASLFSGSKNEVCAARILATPHATP